MKIRKRHKLRPIRTKEQCLAAGSSFRGFRASCVPHVPFLRRLRVAWMVVFGVDIGRLDIDCGGHRDPGRVTSVSSGVVETLREAAGAFGNEDEKGAKPK